MKVGIIGNGMIVPSAIEAMQRGGIAVTALWCRNELRENQLLKSIRFLVSTMIIKCF